MTAVEVSLVIPTYNEVHNIEPLFAELRAALRGFSWEALFVDDSSDGTDQAIAELARSNSQIRLLHRTQNRGGLAGAVVDGLAKAQGSYICVLDADLQHPPACIPIMLSEAQHTAADIVIASRYVPGGSASGLDGPVRRLCSLALKHLSLLLFPRRLAGISDPLGGYFLVRRSIVEGVELRPVGYKILLEILVRCPWQKASEVPYRFEPRRHDESKADFRQGARFLGHLRTLVWDRSPACVIPRLAFGSSLREQAAPTASL